MQAGGQKAGIPIRFTMDDVESLTTNVPQIMHITPEVDKHANVQYETRAFNFEVTGNYPNVVRIRVLELAQRGFLQRGRPDAEGPRGCPWFRG